MVKKMHSMAITCKSMIEIMRFFIIALLPVHICSAMVPPCMARVFTKHKQVIILTLCPTGMGVARVNGVVLSIGEQLLSERHWLRGAYDQPDCVDCSDRARSKGSQFVVGLCTVPCNERYHTLKNYKLCHLDT